MTFKYNNVYINEVSTVVGPYEKKGPLSKYFDLKYDDLYMGKKNWEEAEVKLNLDSVSILLSKLNMDKSNIDIHIGGDLLNQICATNYSSSKIGIPLIGIYSACSTSTLGILLGSNMIDIGQINNAIVTTSSHNNTSEKQFRNPVEYGGPKKVYSTFTATGACACFLSNKKSNIKVDSATLGIVSDMGIKDVSNMGGVMASAAGDTIYNHLKETNRDISYYDFILTGDLGRVGKLILKDYMKEKYNINLKRYDDSGCILFDVDKQDVYSGGSGPTCLPLVTYTYLFDKMKKGNYKRVLLVGTGALMNTTMCNHHLSIPSIAHAISLEVI